MNTWADEVAEVLEKTDRAEEVNVLSSQSLVSQLEFGQLITADHIYVHDERVEGVTGDREALIVYDYYSGCL